MRDRRGSSLPLVLGLLGVLAMGVALLVWCPWCPVPDDPPPLPPPIKELLEEARALHSEGKWPEAEVAWQKLIVTLPTGEYSDLRREAERNLQTAKDEQKDGVTEVVIPEPPDGDRPAAVPEDELVRFYQVGKTVRSVSLVNITGFGSNKDWVFEEATHFAYQYRLAVETKVVENRGTAVVFEQHFQDVSSTLAQSHRELALVVPDLPVLQLIWGEVENQLLEPIPIYVVARRLATLATTADPNLKRTLTFFANQLPDHRPEDDIGVVAQIDRLAGLRLRIEYVSGLGVTHIEVLDGKTFDALDLERIAYNSSLLMDYFISQGASKPAGESVTIRSQDVRGAFSPYYDVDTSGSLTLKKQIEADRNGEQLAILEVMDDGEVSLRSTSEGMQRSGTIRPLAGGFVRYSEDKLLVRLARIAWEVEGSWETTDHLLFGAEGLRKIAMETYYEADIASSGP